MLMQASRAAPFLPEQSTMRAFGCSTACRDAASSCSVHEVVDAISPHPNLPMRDCPVYRIDSHQVKIRSVTWW